MLVVVGAGLAAAYAAGLRSGAGAVTGAAPSRLAILSPLIGGTGVATQFRQLALTPDGEAVVFVAITPDNRNALAYQRLDAPRSTFIEGGQGLLSPQISPDGASVIGWGAGLFSGEQERAIRVPIGGGTRVPLAPTVRTRHGHWAADGSYWFSHSENGGATRLAADGSVVPALGGRTDGLQVQQVLGDGRTAIAVRSPFGTASGPGVLLDLESGRERPLIDLATVEVRVTAGHLLHVRPDGTMWAAPFDERAQRVTGGAVQIADGVSVTGTQVAQWAVSPAGTVAYIPEEPRSLVLVGRDGAARPAVALQRNFHSPRFSPDGRQLAVDFTSADGRDVWILSLGQRTLSRATFTRDGHDATWMPDGRALTFTSFYGGNVGVLRVRPGSAAPAESLFASPKLAYTGEWLPDASGLVTVAADLQPGSGPDLAIIGGGGRGGLRPLVLNQFDTQYPAVSPDGRWVAFVSNQSGAQQVFVRPLADGGDETQVSPDGGTEPVWSHDGRELFYFGATHAGTELIAATVRTSSGFEVVSRRELFDASDIVGSNPHANYDVSPDGRTFAMVRRSPANRIVVLQNLPALVRRLRDADQPAP
jgi:hypothetical protein